MRRTPTPVPLRVREPSKYMVQYSTWTGAGEAYSSVHAAMNLERAWDLIMVLDP